MSMTGQIAVIALSLAMGIAVQPLANVPIDEPSTFDVTDECSDDTSRRDFMRLKLMYAQNVLEGLTTDDFEQIETAVKNLQQVTEGEKWLDFKDEKYQEQTKDFKKATAELLEAAKSKNIDATALRFQQLSIRCIDCHKHVRKSDLHL
ncbi:MAG: cytochrome c [bacterium]|nr:cytochrome c [bacterium]